MKQEFIQRFTERVMEAALNNEKITIRLTLKEKKEKTLWAGIGNTSGLHSFANELIREKWAKSEKRIKKVIAELPAGSTIILYREHYVNRDRRQLIPYSRLFVTKNYF